MPTTSGNSSPSLAKIIPLGLLTFLIAGCNGSQIDTKCPSGSLCSIHLTVTVMPAAATLAAGGSTQFTARVDGS